MASGTAYRWKEPGRDVLNVYPQDDQPPLKRYKAPPTRGKGEGVTPTPLLSQLPIELVHNVLFELDMISLGSLRRVNSTTRHLVESFPAWSLLREHASDTLRVMDATKCTAYFPIRWLFDEFCHPRCRTCLDFGPYLYLPTITRCCFKCSVSQRKYRIAPTADVMWHFGMSQKQLKSIPIIYPLPGDHHGKRMVDVWQAKALGGRIHGSLREMNKRFQARVEQRRLKKELALKRWKDKCCDRGPKPQFRRYPNSLVEGAAAFHWRLKGTTSFPYWDRKTATLETGVYCRACTYEEEERNWWVPDGFSVEESKKPYYRAFLEADMPKHFLHCKAVKAKYDFTKKRSYISLAYSRSGTDFYVDVSRAAQAKPGAQRRAVRKKKEKKKKKKKKDKGKGEKTKIEGDEDLEEDEMILL